jgi:flagellar hook-associated protein 1 FlgK
MASVINTGISALNAFKRQIETTGHNIANVNTEGYSRQRVDLATRQPQVSSAGFIGSGVDVSSIQRSYDEYLALRVRDYTSSYEEFSVYEQRARQIDNVIADQSAGIDGIMQQFFASVNDVADDPTSIEARSMMLNRAEQLSDRFNSLDRWFSDIRNRLNQDFERQVNEINSLAQSLVEVNSRIGSLNGLQDGIPPDVLDERDKLVSELSQYTNVSTVTQADGMMSVFVGTGQSLVVGITRNTLAVTRDDYAADLVELSLAQPGGSVVNVTSQMTGGSLGGLLRFRDEVLDESHNALGRVALGLATAFNSEHATGMDLDGDLGGDFFNTLAAPTVLSSAGSPTVTGSFTSIAELTTHEYQINYTGGTPGSWSMTDLTTGGSVAIDVSGGTLSADPTGTPIGFTLDVSAVSGTTDYTYRIRPTRLGASEIGVAVTNERDIAAAEPLIASNARNTSGPLNTGTGSISQGRLETVTGTAATGLPITIEYDTTSGGFLISAGGIFVGSPAYVPGTDSGDTYTVNVTGLGTYSFVMTGTPDDGDTFTIADNSSGTGDNRNARSLADLQNANLMIGGTATFANTYGALVADVGTRTQQAQNNSSIQENLLGQAESAMSEVSGVNLDEEAADLVRFQQAYQAAARVINVANTMFDSLLAAVR